MCAAEKMVFAQSGCIREKWLYSGKGGCIRRESGSIRTKIVVFGQNCCIRAKVVVFGKKRLYSSKVVVFE